jgi:hypothetical protein
MIDDFSNCPSLDWLGVNLTFTGRLELAGAEIIQRFTGGYQDPKPNTSNRRDHDVTEIKLPDLKNVSSNAGMLLGYMPNLTRNDMP